MLGSFAITIYMEKGCISGMMEGCMMGNGSRIRWMGKVFLHGKMEGNTLESMLMTKNKDTVYLSGLTAENTKGTE